MQRTSGAPGKVTTNLIRFARPGSGGLLAIFARPSTWTGAGTHDGELMGMPPTGKSVEIAGITIDRIADDKIAESWTCFDTLGMMQQLGAIPEAQPAGV